MVLVKIAMVGVAIIVLMGVAQNEHWPQRAGVVGKCVATRPLSSDSDTAWYACKQGILTGFPTSRPIRAGASGSSHREVWRCTATLVSLPGY